MLALAEAPMPSTDLCLTFPLNELRSRGILDYTLLYESDISISSLPPSADLLIGLRCVRHSSIEVVTQYQNLGVPFLFMIDDDLGAIPRDHWLFRHYSRIGAKENTRILAEKANAVCVFSENMKSRLKRYSHSIKTLPVFDKAGPNSIDCGHSYSRTFPKNELRIGYAGSPTHSNDIEIISEALIACLLKMGSTFYVETIGQKIKALEKHPRYRHFDFIDGTDKFLEFLKSRNWQIGLAPMEYSALNSAKTNNKYRTYSVAGIAGIYSNVPPFSDSIEDGFNGMIVSNECGSWIRAICELAADEPRRHAIARNAYEDYKQKYSIENVVSSYDQLIKRLVRQKRLLCIVEGVDLFPPRNLPILDVIGADKSILCRFKTPQGVSDCDQAWCDVRLQVRYQSDSRALPLDIGNAPVGCEIIVVSSAEQTVSSELTTCRAEDTIFPSLIGEAETVSSSEFVSRVAKLLSVSGLECIYA